MIRNRRTRRDRVHYLGPVAVSFRAHRVVCPCFVETLKRVSVYVPAGRGARGRLIKLH